MSDLIRRDNLLRFMSVKVKKLADENGWHNHYVTGFDDAITYVEDAPSVDAVEVVHGYWIANNICSVCWKGIIGWAIQNGYKFCPHCGAKMDAKGMDVPIKDGGATDGV